MADTIDIVVNAVDNFSSTLGNFGNIMTGIKSTIDLVTGAFNAAKDAVMPFIDAASESQVALTMFDTALQSTSQGTGVFQETIGQLSNTQLSDLYTRLDNAKNKLAEMKDEYGNARTYTEQESVAIAAQRELVANLTAQIQQGTDGLTIYKDTTKLSRDALIDLSLAMQNTAGYSDELELSAEAMLLRFENINKDIFPQALSLTNDLARALGVDLVSAAQTMGKALDDPESGIGRLNMQFKLFNDTEMETIKNMAANGDIAGAQALIIERLTEKIGGAAEAYGKTFAGSLDIAKEKLDNMRETIGGPIILGLQTLLEVVMNFAETNPTIQSVLSFFDQWRVYMESGASFIGGFGLALANLEGAPLWVKDIGMAFLTINNALQDGIPLWDAIKKGLDDLMIAWQSDNPALTGIITYLQNIINIGETSGWAEAFQQLFSDAWNAIAPVIDKFFSDVFTAMENQINLWIAGGGVNRLSDKIINALSMTIASPEFKSAATKAFVSLVDVIMSVVAGVADNVEVAGTNVVRNFFDNLELQGTNAVRNFFNGIELSITDAIRGWFDNIEINVTDWVRDHIVQPIKDFLGIASPSTVFFEIGRNIVEGLVNGILSLADWMLSQITAFIGNLLAPFAPVLSLLGIDISGLSTTIGTVGGHAGGGTTGTGTGTLGTTTGSMLGSNVTNNFYGPVYFGDLSQLGYDCPTPNPLIAASQGTLLVAPSIG